ncbi:MAG: thioredoxin family protein [Planctomycetaceae bacterium]
MRVSPCKGSAQVLGWLIREWRLEMLDYGAKFETGLGYAEFLEKHGTAEQRDRWAGIHRQIRVSDAQQQLLASFTREMKVLCLSGAWCGDCVNQCPIFDHFERINPQIRMRYFDRDAHPDLGAALSVCGGARVPVLLFLSEDNHQICFYGDRTLAKYRAMAASQLGPACPTGMVPDSQDLQGAVIQDWLNEFERVHLILRLSGRLRQAHGD